MVAKDLAGISAPKSRAKADPSAKVRPKAKPKAAKRKPTEEERLEAQLFGAAPADVELADLKAELGACEGGGPPAAAEPKKPPDEEEEGSQDEEDPIPLATRMKTHPLRWIIQWTKVGSSAWRRRGH